MRDASESVFLCLLIISILAFVVVIAIFLCFLLIIDYNYGMQGHAETLRFASASEAVIRRCSDFNRFPFFYLDIDGDGKSKLVMVIIVHLRSSDFNRFHFILQIANLQLCNRLNVVSHNVG